MQKYAIAALGAAVLMLGWLYHSANSELADTKTSLAVAMEINQTNRAAISRLESSIRNTNDVLARWNEDRETLAGIRSATRQAIREAMHDESFKAWASGTVPPAVWGVLGKASNNDANGNGSAVSTCGTSGKLPGNACPGRGQ